MTLGEGAYARVVHARHKETDVEYAMKIMDKEFIKKEDKVKLVLQERNVVSSLRHPGVIKLAYTFQDKDYLFLALELCPGGELLKLIQRERTAREREGEADSACRPEVARYYAAAVVVVLRYLHGEGIVHRDLKPENILLDAHGRIRVADFGTCKRLGDESAVGTAFVGTAEYVSPEVLSGEGEVGCAADLWALGCMLYQLVAGRPPFRADTEYLLFQEILDFPGNGAVEFPPSFPAAAKDLVLALLVPDPLARLGCAGRGGDGGIDYDAVQAHPFFAGVDWASFWDVAPPAAPPRSSLPPCTVDGATEDWLLAGVATELDSADFRSPSEVEHLAAAAMDHAAPPDEGGARHRRLSGAEELHPFLEPDETIVCCGTVSKRRGLFSRVRTLALTSAPRLFYVDSRRKEVKGTIPFCPELRVELRGEQSFDVVVPGRVYHFSVISGTTGRGWMHAIMDAARGAGR